MKEGGSIPCTVGMLALNVASTLERSLRTVQEFDEVIIADGGSTDSTRVIGEQYHARFIEQTCSGRRIADFSRERNLLLSATTQPWFLWLDPDEYLSEELLEEVREVCTSRSSKYQAYRLRIERVDPDTLEPYVTLRPNYQVRLFSMAAKPRYENKVHEHVVFATAVTIGTLRGAWCVPMTRKTFAEYKHAVDTRFPLLVAEKPAYTFRQYVLKGVLRPSLNGAKALLRTLVVRLRYPLGHHMPWHIELGRLYTQWVIMKEHGRQYFSGKETRK